MARYETAGDLINRAAVEVGLSESGDPYLSNDKAFKQLTKLLISLGQKLIRRFDWTQFQTPANINTTGSPNQYSVPSDFLKFINRTAWDSANNLRMSGSKSPAIWQVLINEPVSATIYIQYREIQNQFWLFPVNTASGLVLPYEYIRNTWAYSAGPSYKTAPTEASDVVEFDPPMIVAGLKAAFLSARGFPSTAAKAEFLDAYEDATGLTASGEILSLLGAVDSERLLSVANIPDTGFGS